MSLIQTKFKEALALHQEGQLTSAKAIYEEILAMEPNFAHALHLLGLIAYQTKNFQSAVELINRAININPANTAFYSNRGNALQELQQFEAAIESYDQALAIKPDFAESYFNRGNALHKLERFEAAVESYSRAIAIQSNVPEIYFNRGLALHDLERWEEAVENYDHVIALKPNYAEAHFNRGLALKKLNQLRLALESYDRAISFKPDYVGAYFSRGNALLDLKQAEAALESYDRAIAIKPDLAIAYVNRGNALQELKQLEEALKSYDRAIAIQPDLADAFSNRGNALQGCSRLDEALESFDRAIALKPDFVDAHVNRGNALRKLKKMDAALESYDRAISIQPNCAAAYANRATTLQEMKRFEAAVASYNTAIAIQPDFDYLLGVLLHTKAKLCDWVDFDDNIAKLVQRIEQGEKASTSFPLLSLMDCLSAQKKASEIVAKDKYPADCSLGNILKKPRSEKIRIGYFSADFYFHPVSILLAEVFELHDRNRFEVIGISFKNDLYDAMRARVENAFDQFVDVHDLSDKAAAQLIRNMKLDVAIDLGGDTAHSRTGIFSHRVAPVQVSYIGYLGTMGADYFDYLIADQTIIPEESQQYYVEKIAYLPSYQANDSKRVISEKVFTRSELNLPSEGFVFCCFNFNYKITPHTFDGWMRILKAVTGSVLFLYTENETAVQNLRKEAQIRGVEPSRLIFGGRLSPDEYLARYRTADLFLDTFPYNAGTTASDALWAGLPLLTLSGESFASRVAASLLNAIEMPELITHTQAQYETLAIELATNPTKLNAIKEKLATNRLTTPLFNTKLFTRHIENAYTQMVERYHAELAPDHIYVESNGCVR